MKERKEDEGGKAGMEVFGFDMNLGVPSQLGIFGSCWMISNSCRSFDVLLGGVWPRGEVIQRRRMNFRQE